jgi:hypothetical protein
MMTSNNALVPDADKEDTIASKPFDWPWLYNGMRMNGWQDNGIKYYLVGNAVVWWMASASLGIWAVTLLWHLMRFQRKINDFAPGSFRLFSSLSLLCDELTCIYSQASGTTSSTSQRSRSVVGLSITVRLFSPFSSFSLC